MACRFLERTFSQPFTKTVPIGVGALSDFVKEVSEIVGANEINAETYSQLPWYSASVDSTYLTGKRVFILEMELMQWQLPELREMKLVLRW